MRLFTALILSFLSSLSMTEADASFVIDDFEQGGPFSLVADEANTSVGNSSSPISVPGGAREVLLTAPPSPGYAVNAALAATADDDAVVFSGMNPPNSGFSAANINYGDMIAGRPELNLDLTQFGDRFYFKVADDVPFSGYSIVLILNSRGMGGFSPTIPGVPGSGNYIVPDGSGQYEVPFSYFSTDINGTLLDPADIDGLNVWIISQEVRVDSPPLKITELGVVPEPSMLVLSTVGLVVFAAWGWRHRVARLGGRAPAI